MATTHNEAAPETSTDVVAPFTREAMLGEFFDALYHWSRSLGMALGNEPVLRMLAPHDAVRDYDWYAELPEDPAPSSFIAEARGWEITPVLEKMYDFGMLGLDHEGWNSMGDETEYTYVSAFLLDLMDGKVREELEAATGTDFFPRMAIAAAQAAAARLLLEEHGEVFYSFPGQGNESDGLTIRDVAMLARMEEKSVRNAANPKRSGHLKTYSVDGSTYVHPKDAKEWLSARGRYVPLRRVYEIARIDLESTAFADTLQAWRFIEARFRSLDMSAEEFGALVQEPALRERAHDSSASENYLAVDQAYEFGIEQARDQSSMIKFARALQLPEALFLLRMREAAAVEELSAVRTAVRSTLEVGGEGQVDSRQT